MHILLSLYTFSQLQIYKHFYKIAETLYINQMSHPQCLINENMYAGPTATDLIEHEDLSLSEAWRRELTGYLVNGEMRDTYHDNRKWLTSDPHSIEETLKILQGNYEPNILRAIRTYNRARVYRQGIVTPIALVANVVTAEKILFDEWGQHAPPTYEITEACNEFFGISDIE